MAQEMIAFAEPLTLQSLEDPFQLIERAKKGIKAAAIALVGKQFGISDRELARILNLSERTLHRLQPESRLTPAQTERLLSLVRLYLHGEALFNGLPRFRQWLLTQPPALAGKTPLELLDSYHGMTAVENLLTRTGQGVYS